MEKQENSTLKSKLGFKDSALWFAFFTSVTYWIDRLIGNL
jgi:hypothetical protein